MARSWERDLKKAVADTIKAASDLWNLIEDLGEALFEEGVSLLKSLLGDATTALSGILDEITNMMEAIAEVASGIKTLLCDLMSDAVKLIPPEIVAGVAAVSAVKNISLTKDINDLNVVGMRDVKRLSTTILNDLGIKSMKGNLINHANSMARQNLNLHNYRCVYTPPIV